MTKELTSFLERGIVEKNSGKGRGGLATRDSRRKQMADLIAKKHSVSMDELCQTFHVSMNTVRADLAYLVQTGAVEKVYGGARSSLPQEVPLFTQRTGLNPDAKARIARRAETLVRDRDIIFIDNGTTTMHLLDFLDPFKRVTVLTGNLHLVTQAYSKPNVELIVLPGVMNHRTNSVSDGSTLEFLGRYHCAKAFMGVSGVSGDGKLNVSSYIEYELKKLAVRQSREAYLLCDSSKFGGSGLMSYGSLSDMDEVITDAGCPERVRAFCEQKNIRLILAD